MPYTVEQLRGTRADDGWLWRWGEIMAHGAAPASPQFDPDRYRLAVNYASRPPCHDEITDLSLAFAALHDFTAGLYSTSIAWFAHARDISRHQQVIHAYYVAGLGYRDQRARVAAMSPHQRQTWLDTLEHLRRQYPNEPEIDELDGDALVALTIPKVRGEGHISHMHANTLRNEAIRRMCAYLNRHPRQLASVA
jgi:hypothetical protein